MASMALDRLTTLNEALVRISEEIVSQREPSYADEKPCASRTHHKKRLP